MKSLMRTVAVGALLLSLAPAALAQDGVRFTIGVKAWVHTWSTWTGSQLDGSVGQTETDSETVLVPSLNLRIGNFFVSGDFFPEKEYDFLNNTYRGVKRSEWSVVGGYYLVPQLAIALGFKQINQNFGSTFDATLSVPMLGLQAGAPIGDSGNWFIYGNGFFGPVDFKEKNSTALDNQKGWYYSTEIGTGYRFFDRLAGTVGYKYQTVRWDELNQKNPGYDYTAGWIFGLSFTF